MSNNGFLVPRITYSCEHSIPFGPTTADPQGNGEEGSILTECYQCIFELEEIRTMREVRENFHRRTVEEERQVVECWLSSQREIHTPNPQSSQRASFLDSQPEEEHHHHHVQEQHARIQTITRKPVPKPQIISRKQTPASPERELLLTSVTPEREEKEQEHENQGKQKPRVSKFREEMETPSPPPFLLPLPETPARARAPTAKGTSETIHAIASGDPSAIKSLVAAHIKQLRDRIPRARTPPSPPGSGEIHAANFKIACEKLEKAAQFWKETHPQHSESGFKAPCAECVKEQRSLHPLRANPVSQSSHSRK